MPVFILKNLVFAFKTLISVENFAFSPCNNVEIVENSPCLEAKIGDFLTLKGLVPVIWGVFYYDRY